MPEEKEEEFNETNNTTGFAGAVETGDEHEVESLLGPAFKMPTKGIIRSGIMALKKGCSPEDQKIYDEMAGKFTWEEIKKKLGPDKDKKNKLRPVNVDYFTIHEKDCTDTADIKKIMDLYADKDGRLRSFLVWFPMNNWWDILPHSLRCFGQTGLKFKGVIRNGRMLCEFPTDRATGKRTFGKQPWGVRPCDPDMCKEFQAEECKFGGVVQFYIPGISGNGLWRIPTTSWHSLLGLKSNIKLIQSIMGRVSGLLKTDPNQPPLPFLRLSKKLTTLYYTDPKGQRRSSEQALITLDTTVDMMTIAQMVSDVKQIEARGQQAIGLLDGPRRPRERYRDEIPEWAKARSTAGADKTPDKVKADVVDIKPTASLTQPTEPERDPFTIEALYHHMSDAKSTKALSDIFRLGQTEVKKTVTPEEWAEAEKYYNEITSKLEGQVKPGGQKQDGGLFAES